MTDKSYVFSDKESEEIVGRYLTNHAYDPRRINTKKLPIGTQSPDFKTFDGENLKFYCEVKNPLLLANDITKMFHWTTSVSKIRRFVHKAVQQFRDIDVNHEFPWIIAFTSGNFQLNWVNFSDAYLGYVSRNGQMICDLRNEKYVMNYNSDVNTIDAYLWFQVNPEKARIYQYVPFVNYDSILKQKNFNHSRKRISWI